MSEFKTELGETIFKTKYASNPYETWTDKSHSVVNSVCGDFNGLKTPLMEKKEIDRLVRYITEFKFMPGGRYLWYAGRSARFYNNCYLLRLEEDKGRVGWSYAESHDLSDDRRWYWCGYLKSKTEWSSIKTNRRCCVWAYPITAYAQRGRQECNARRKP